MAKKSLKLSKNAIMLMCSIILITLVVLVFIILKYDDRQIEKPEVKSEQLSSLVVENQVLKVELVDLISNKNYHKGYQEVTMDIQKDEEILGYKIYNIFIRIIDKHELNELYYSNVLTKENMARYYTNGLVSFIELWVDKGCEYSGIDMFEAYTYMVSHSIMDIIKK